MCESNVPSSPGQPSARNAFLASRSNLFRLTGHSKIHLSRFRGTLTAVHACVEGFSSAAPVLVQIARTLDSESGVSCPRQAQQFDTSQPARVLVLLYSLCDSNSSRVAHIYFIASSRISLAEYYVVHTSANVILLCPAHLAKNISLRCIAYFLCWLRFEG